MRKEKTERIRKNKQRKGMGDEEKQKKKICMEKKLRDNLKEKCEKKKKKKTET